VPPIFKVKPVFFFFLCFSGSTLAKEVLLVFFGGSPARCLLLVFLAFVGFFSLDFEIQGEVYCCLPQQEGFVSLVFASGLSVRDPRFFQTKAQPTGWRQ